MGRIKKISEYPDAKNILRIRFNYPQKNSRPTIRAGSCGSFFSNTALRIACLVLLYYIIYNREIQHRINPWSQCSLRFRIFCDNLSLHNYFTLTKKFYFYNFISINPPVSISGMSMLKGREQLSTGAVNLTFAASRDKINGAGLRTRSYEPEVIMRKIIKDPGQIVKDFFDIDEAAETAKVRLHFDSPKEIFDVNCMSKTPIFSDDFDEWLQSAFVMIPSKYKLALDITFDDMDGYTSEQLDDIFKKTCHYPCRRFFTLCGSETALPSG